MNTEKQFNISLRCVFCDSTQFEIPYQGYQPSDGEVLKCVNCGKLNDYSSLREVAIEKGRNEAKKCATGLIEGELKKIRKKWK